MRRVRILKPHCRSCDENIPIDTYCRLCGRIVYRCLECHLDLRHNTVLPSVQESLALCRAPQPRPVKALFHG